MGTIAGSPRPNGPIGYGYINGQRIEIFPTDIWWRHWTEQFDGTRFIAPGSITSVTIQQGSATDILSASLALFDNIAASHVPDGEIYRNEAIGIEYTADRNCTVLVSFNSLYEAESAADCNVSIIGGLYVEGDFAGGGDSIQTFDRLRSPDYEIKGSFSASASFTMAAGETKRFVFLPKFIETLSSVTRLEMKNLYLRVEAVKV
jgi:hypothetical protein